MSVETVKAYFSNFGMAERVMEFDDSSATVEQAAQALNVKPERIAKTLSFRDENGCILIVTAGDAKIDNQKFKATLGFKARMLAPEEVLALVGHEIGGVCPFGVSTNIPIYLDKSLKRFSTVFPACGSKNSAIELTCDELYRFSNAKEWVDVCKGWEPAGDQPLPG
jgi:prolyl-tRNA editing enzyme YbaK/EbsC (Cys-tRNA(Pro) deacylase)